MIYYAKPGGQKKINFYEVREKKHHSDVNGSAGMAWQLREANMTHYRVRGARLQVETGLAH